MSFKNYNYRDRSSYKESLRETSSYKDSLPIIASFYKESENEVRYRKCVITDETLMSENSEKNNHVTIEKYNVKSYLNLVRYMNHRLKAHKKKDRILNEKDYIWFKTYLRALKRCTEVKNYGHVFLTSSFIFIQKKYTTIQYPSLNEEFKETFKENDKNLKVIGRMYNSSTAQILPRELRYILFKEDYIDIDMKNAHPTLMFLYSLNKNLEMSQTKALKTYIEKRDEILLNIFNELKDSKNSKRKIYKSLLEEPENYRNIIKEQILKIMNRQWEKTDNGSKTLNDLDNDFTVIRENLWSDFKKGLMKEFEESIHDKYFKEPTIENKKVRLLALYNQTEENKHLIKFIKFIQIKYKEFLEENKIKKTRDIIPETDKGINFDLIKTMSIIPFFDGVYVSSPYKKFNNKIEKIIKEYNKEKNYIKFVKKEIKIDKKHIETPEEIELFSNIQEWLAEPSHFKKMNKFMLLLNISSEEIEEYVKKQYFEENIEKKIIELLNDLSKTEYFYKKDKNTFIDCLKTEQNRIENLQKKDFHLAVRYMKDLYIQIEINEEISYRFYKKTLKYLLDLFKERKTIHESSLTLFYYNLLELRKKKEEE